MRRAAAQPLVELNQRLLEKVKELEKDLAEARHLACHDALTGLPNRALLLDRLKQAMLQAVRRRKAVGVLLLDLDGFKSVNDRLGHGAGDLVLQRVAARLVECIRACDTVCRYGGDEFVILLPEIHGAEDLGTVVHKIRSGLSKPHRFGDGFVFTRVSIGISVYREGDLSCGELIDMADAAMYRAKACGVAAPAAGRQVGVAMPGSPMLRQAEHA